ncbi:MAG: hypothetical protein ACREXT_01730, partial [Gammaproteobacteria bacterium]
AERPRQAVVLIHGIGEQRPMDTLRAFVGSLLKKETYYSKPDELSGSFELRRLKLRRSIDSAPPINARWPETDFYEYYWAHQMYGTVISHITGWIWRVMWRGLAALWSHDARYHRRLKWLVPLVWTIALGALVAAAYYLVGVVTDRTLPFQENVGKIGIGMALAIVAWRLLRATLLAMITDVAGDAARYFDINPKNVARRYDILRGGVDMLRKLHEDCDRDGDRKMFRYGRIVLIGHSLGSVIAYDILKHYFHEVNGHMSIDPRDFAGVENFAGRNNGAPTFDGARPYSDASEYRFHQRETWRTVNAATPSGSVLRAEVATASRWIVTDLITMGSPMTYGPILLADGLEDLNEKIRLRELPTCPPDRSHNLNQGRFTVMLSAEADRIVDYSILQHHAYFALTRWTNFYFHNDPVGGPLSAIFGNGIKDVHLKGPAYRPLAAHVSYWKRACKGGGRCLARVRKILTEPVNLCGVKDKDRYQACRYARDAFRPSCPRNALASRDK